MTRWPASLLVSLHDVAPTHLDAIRRQRDALAAWGVARATLLVVPDFHGEAPLERSPATVRFVRACLAAGDEVALHGHTHRAARPAPGVVARWRAAITTAGEGECLTQSESERVAMLGEVRRRVEELLGARLGGFVAPAWLEAPALPAALAAAGFAWHERAAWVEWFGVDGAAPRRVYTPVIGFATRSRARAWTSRLWAAALTPGLAAAALGGRGPARVALHPADLGDRAITAATERAVRRLATRLPATTYAALGAAAAPGRSAPTTSSKISAMRRDVNAAE